MFEFKKHTYLHVGRGDEVSQELCSMCGKELGLYDKQNDLKMNYKIGFGSIYDGDRLRACFCNECFDSLIDYMKKRCKHPILKSMED